MRNVINLVESMRMENSEKWSSEDISAILMEAKKLGFNGFGGECGEAAIAINDVIFDGNGVLIAAVNKAFFTHGSFIGHVAVYYNGIFWDADGVPKDETDVDHWGMLDYEDTDYQATASKCGFEWTEEAADTFEMIQFEDDSEVLEYFNSGKLNEMLNIIEQAIINHQKK